MTASDEDEWIDFMASIAIEFSTCIHNGENSGKQTLRSVCFPEFSPVCMHVEIFEMVCFHAYSIHLHLGGCHFLTETKTE